MELMLAMVLERPGTPLRARRLPRPTPGPGEVLLRVEACGVCRTDLHIYDGELSAPQLPLILGHEIVGRVVACGAAVQGLDVGSRVGVPWLGGICGTCAHCQSGRENLCPAARFTGYTQNGGYAEYAVASARFCLPLPEELDAAAAAPLLCAGLIGYRSLRLAGPGRRLGLYGFGAAAHLVCQLACWEGRDVYAFTRPEDQIAQDFARSCGALWAGPADRPPPHPLDAAIIFAPVGALVPAALAAVGPGGTVVCGGIHMSDIPAFPYRLLWEERTLRSVANLTRSDGLEFLPLAARVPLRTTIETFPLTAADDALQCLRRGTLRGAAVLLPPAG